MRDHQNCKQGSKGLLNFSKDSRKIVDCSLNFTIEILQKGIKESKRKP